MLISPPIKPITADDDTIRRALEAADISALLPALAQLTGDLSILHDEFRPDTSNPFDAEAGLTEAQVAEARALALDALIRFRDGGAVAAGRPTDEQLHMLMGFMIGDDNVLPYFELLSEELALDGEDLRAPGWHTDEIRGTETADRTDAAVDFTVAIVGAGMSGILAAHRLQQAGVPYVIFEKNDDVGGTWFENTYPGCRVDVPNHLYSYSFAPTVWSHHYSSQQELLDYFRACTHEFELREHIRFGTEVVDAVFDETRDTWTVRVRTGDNAIESFEANAVISAVGQLNRPNFPDIAGRESFAGTSFHSAQWDTDLDLTGKRVAIIGTGASAAQFIPIVAEQAGDLTIFQRTPNWFAPTPDYHDPVPDGMRWLLDHVPSYGQWYRLWQFWRMHEGLLPAAYVDPDWPKGGSSVSAINEMVRELLAENIRTEFADAPELWDQVIPTYPPIAKRIVRDNGIWARTLTRDDTHLVSDAIDRIEPHAVVTADGVEHEVDVIIYGTGFEASHFLTPMKIIGRGGIELHDQWQGDARAYLGITVPNFPNLFCLYGPNTNIVINGSIIYFSECEVRYIVESIHQLLAGGHRAMDCRKDVHDAFNERIDVANRNMAWGASTVNSWYKNELGRVAQNWPFTLLEYWQQARIPNLDDYLLT